MKRKNTDSSDSISPAPNDAPGDGAEGAVDGSAKAPAGDSGTAVPQVPAAGFFGDGFWVAAPEDELVGALESVGGDLDLEDARAALRNPFASARVVELLLEVEGLRSSYRWRKDLVWSRLTPPAIAMSLVPGLYWRDLAQLARDVRVYPRLRRQAEELLLQRLQKLALGERIALARIATTPLIAVLRKDPNDRVFRALLENSRLQEGALLALAMNTGTQPGILRTLARDRRWGSRYEIRRALVRNPRTPLQEALNLVATLKKVDLRSLVRDAKVRREIRQRCRLRLGEGA